MAVALPLFEPGLYHDLDSEDTSYFAIFRKLSGGSVKTECFDTRAMPDIVHACAGLPDTYISQGDFTRPQRLTAALKSLGLFWADLGDDGELAKLGDAAAVNAILAAVKEADIPYPSFIVSSGRGYHAKWLFSSRVGRANLPRWGELEGTVTRLLRDPLNADPRATDAARVLRLVDTINTRTNTITRVVYRNLDDRGEIVRYDFEALFRSIVPPNHDPHETGPRIAQGRRREARQSSSLIVPVNVPVGGVDPKKTWYGKMWWNRLEDERNLFAERKWTPENGGVPKGYRDIALFIGATALTWFAPPSAWWNETQSLAAEFAPGLRESEWRAYMGSTWRRMMSGDRYRYRNARLAELLDVSRDEMTRMKCLVDEKTARERILASHANREEHRRRARGQVDRMRYLTETNERTLALAREAQELIDAGFSLRKAASELGVSRGSIDNALRVARGDSFP